MSIQLVTKQMFDNHLAESVTEIKYLTRDATITGLQTVGGLRKKPRSIQLWATNAVGINRWSLGYYTGLNNVQVTLRNMGNTFATGSDYSFILYNTTWNDSVEGIIKNVTENSFDIEWVINGTGITGTISLIVIINY